MLQLFYQMDVSYMKHILTLNSSNTMFFHSLGLYLKCEINCYGCFKMFSIQHRSWKLCNLVPTLIRSCLSHKLPSGIGARHLCFTGSNLPANVIYLVFNISVISLFSTSSSTSQGAQNRCSEVNLGKKQMKIIHRQIIRKHKEMPLSTCAKITCERKRSFTSEFKKPLGIYQSFLWLLYYEDIFKIPQSLSSIDFLFNLLSYYKSQP